MVVTGRLDISHSSSWAFVLFCELTGSRLSGGYFIYLGPTPSSSLRPVLVSSALPTTDCAVHCSFWLPGASGLLTGLGESMLSRSVLEAPADVSSMCSPFSISSCRAIGASGSGVGICCLAVVSCSSATDVESALDPREDNRSSSGGQLDRKAFMSMGGLGGRTTASSSGVGIAAAGFGD
jgi:hypothetical protein